MPPSRRRRLPFIGVLAQARVSGEGSRNGENPRSDDAAPARRAIAPRSYRSHRTRRRLRRHRYKPALWVQTGRRRGGNDLAGKDYGRGVSHSLVARPDRVVQICHPDHARRQPRRGRHRGAPGPARHQECAPRQLARLPDDRWSDRRRPALWRRGHHAGHLGTQRRRGSQARCASACARCGSDQHCDPGRPVPSPAQGHGVHRQHLRAGDAALVLGHRRARHAWDHWRTEHPGRTQPASCVDLPGPIAAGDRLCRARRCLPHPDGRRGDVCRYGAFRSPADPPRLVRRGFSRFGAQLSRSRGVASVRPTRSKTHSTCWRRAGPITRWWHSRPSRRS
jgi:hypothetical protein